MSGQRLAIVTGGAGFIGGHMVDLLVAEGFAVRVAPGDHIHDLVVATRRIKRAYDGL